MEAMRKVYAKNGPRSQHMSHYSSGKRSQNANDYCEREACIVCEQCFRTLVNHSMNPVVKVLFNPFTPESDQCQNSPAGSQEI